MHKKQRKQSQANLTSVLDRKHGKKHRMPASIRSVRWWSLLTNVIGEDLCLFRVIYAGQESVSILNRWWLDIVIQCKFSTHPSLPELSTVNHLFSYAIFHKSDRWRQWINYYLAVSMGFWIFQKALLPIVALRRWTHPKSIFFWIFFDQQSLFENNGDTWMKEKSTYYWHRGCSLVYSEGKIHTESLKIDPLVSCFTTSFIRIWKNNWGRKKEEVTQ